MARVEIIMRWLEVKEREACCRVLCRRAASPKNLFKATGIEGLKMTDSPVKQPDFTVQNKENSDVAVKVVGIPELDLEAVPESNIDASVAETIKEEEAHEILLQENPNRFVLFPIQHHTHLLFSHCISHAFYV